MFVHLILNALTEYELIWGDTQHQLPRRVELRICILQHFESKINKLPWKSTFFKHIESRIEKLSWESALFRHVESRIDKLNWQSASFRTHRFENRKVELRIGIVWHRESRIGNLSWESVFFDTSKRESQVAMKTCIFSKHQSEIRQVKFQRCIFLHIGAENKYDLLLLINKWHVAPPHTRVRAFLARSVDGSLPNSSAIHVGLYKLIHRRMCVNVSGPACSKSWRTYASP